MAAFMTSHADVSVCAVSGNVLALCPASCQPPQIMTHCDNCRNQPRMSDGCLIEDMPAVLAPARQRALYCPAPQRRTQGGMR